MGLAYTPGATREEVIRTFRFDPRTVQDHATDDQGPLPSTGFRHVLVGGVSVVHEGRVVENVFPGRAITR